MRKRFGMSIAVALAITAAVACDVQRSCSQITAEKAMVASVLAMPSVSISPAALAGADAGFDPGGLDGGEVTIPPQTVAFVFFGERSNTSLDAPPTPILGAATSIRENGGAAVALEETGQGAYSLSSSQEPALEYTSGASYDFEVAFQGRTYVGRVEDAPQLEQVPEFHPAQGYIDHPANTPFTFTRPEPPQGQERNLGFITVYPIDAHGEKGDPTFTNVPKTALQFLKLVVEPSEWRQGEVTVPGTAFPVPEHAYLLVLQAAKMGGPHSDNLFTGSAILAGTAEVGVFRTH